MIENKFGLELIAAVKRGAEQLKNADKEEVTQFLQRVGVIPNMNRNRKIELCSNCKGEGVVSWDELVNHHKGEYETYSKECASCNGTGRTVLVEESHVIRQAFVPRK